MKITKSYLKQVIKEELERLQEEVVAEIGNYSLHPSRDGTQVILQASGQKSGIYTIAGASFDNYKSAGTSKYYTLDTDKGKISVLVSACTMVHELDLSKVPVSVKSFVQACKENVNRPRTNK